MLLFTHLFSPTHLKTIVAPFSLSLFSGDLIAFGGLSREGSPPGIILALIAVGEEKEGRPPPPPPEKALMNGCYTTVMVIMGRSEREERENFFSRREKAGLLQRSSGHNGGTLSDLSAARVMGHKKHHLHKHNRGKEGEKEGVSLSLSPSLNRTRRPPSQQVLFSSSRIIAVPLPLPFLLIQRPTSKGNPPPPPIAPCISSAESPPDMQCSTRRRRRRRRRRQSGGNCCGAITTCSRTAVEGGCCIRKRLEFDHFSRNRTRRTTIFNKKDASSKEQHDFLTIW